MTVLQRCIRLSINIPYYIGVYILCLGIGKNNLNLYSMKYSSSCIYAYSYMNVYTYDDLSITLRSVYVYPLCCIALCVECY